VAISGFLHAPEEYPLGFGQAAAAQRILWTHGTDDPVIPIAQAERGLRRLRELGLEPDWRVYDKVHTVQVPEELDDIRAWIAERLDGVPA
jgi:phospholipase/carboxylesterase